jgi:hypothetical protein
MAGYIMDLTIVAVLIIAITALMGVMLNGIGTKVFGGRNKRHFVEKSESMQTGWKNVGGFSKK